MYCSICGGEETPSNPLIYKTIGGYVVKIHRDCDSDFNRKGDVHVSSDQPMLTEHE